MNGASKILMCKPLSENGVFALDVSLIMLLMIQISFILLQSNSINEPDLLF